MRRLALALAIVTGTTATAPAAAEANGFECVIEPAMTVKLATPLSGVIREVFVDRGDFVKANALVARQESTLDEKNVAIAKRKAENDAELRMAQEGYNLDSTRLVRKEELHRRQVVSQEVYDKQATDARLRLFEIARAKETIELAKLEVQRTEAVVELRRIRSPIDGVVVARRMAPGEYVTDERHILEIAKLDPLYVNTHLPIALYRSVRVGTTASVRMVGLESPTIEAKVTVKDSVADAASGTFAIRLEFPNPKFEIASGVHCKVQLAVD